MVENSVLSSNQRKAMAALLAVPTLEEAAKKCGLHRNTLARYLSIPMFRLELSNREAEIIAATQAAITGATGAAVKTLKALVENEGTSDAVKCRAAVALLDRAGSGETADKSHTGDSVTDWVQRDEDRRREALETMEGEP